MKVEIEIFYEDGGYIARVVNCPFPQLSQFNAFGDTELRAFKELCIALRFGADTLIMEGLEDHRPLPL